MYSVLHSLLSDKKGDIVFSCFGVWHLIYILIVFVIAFLAIYFLRSKTQESKNRVTKIFINIAFAMYILDFFLMPFAYGEIDIEKLPFHICTAMCVMCFLSRHNHFLEKYSLHFALLGFISNLVYLLYPAGVMWYQVHPLSYRVIQTLAFHGCMVIYCLLALVFDEKRLEWKKCYRDLIVVSAMTLWAVIGNALYNGNGDGYSHNFNWFFVLQDPFYLLPKEIAPFIMPILNIVLFFTVDMLIYFIYFSFTEIKREKIKR